MNTISLQRIFTIDHIDQDAEKIGAMILANASPEERRPIYEYGRHVLAGAQPSHGCTVRFFGALAQLTPRLPGYADCIATLADSEQAISAFQGKIALFVLLRDREQG
jgi:hypothetical protein